MAEQGGGIEQEGPKGPYIERTYKIGNDEVELTGNVLLPKDGKVADESEVALFLVGAPMRAKASVTWDTPRGLAEASKVRAYTLDARPKGHFEQNSIALEVEAIRRFIEGLNKEGIKRITLFGHSIGVKKAVDLAVLLEQQNPEITINAAVLSNPMGFYSQDGRDLLFNRYLKEVQNEGRLRNPRAPHESLLKVGWQLVGSLASDVAAAGTQYPRLAQEQLQAVTEKNPNLSKIKSPVVVLLAADDQWAEVKNILPEDEIKTRTAPPIPDEDLRKQIWESNKWERLPEAERAKFGTKEAFVEDYFKKYRTREEMARVGKARRKYMREKIMPQAGPIEVIEAKKYATHVAFGVERQRHTSHLLAEVKRVVDRVKKAA